MALEIVLRFRCGTCGMAIEMLQVVPAPVAPIKFDVTAPAVPHGWERDEKGNCYCPSHPIRRVVPASGLPAESLIRKH